ncbi:MAG: hypothetical protein JJE52_13030 [Acidimicrobiia bacterium]|nr:hypothetical protein [Acidimicrobiia bacterium]
MARLPEAVRVDVEAWGGEPDNVVTVPIAALDPEPVGRLDLTGRVELDQALRFALAIVY